MISARSRFVLALGTLVAVYLGGTTGYLLIESEAGVSVGEAAYMTVITLSTVGYGEVWPLSPAGRVWTGLVIFFGIAAVSFAFTSLVTLLVSGEIQSMRGRKKVESQLRQMSDHAIICGYGRMGSMATAELLAEQFPTVVVELNRDVELDLLDMGVPCVIGDATDEHVLQQAGLERARLLVAVLPHDVDNVYVTLTAHTMRPDLAIIARAEQPRSETKLTRAGARRVVCPTVIGARAIGNMIMRPNVTDFVEVARKGVELEMDEYVLGPQSPLVGLSLRDARVRSAAQANVVAIKRRSGETIYTPGAEIALAQGDTLIMVGQAGMSSRLDQIGQIG